MTDWTSISNAVRELLEVIDDEHFRPERMTITPDKHNKGTLVVAAFDKDNKPFKYAMYVNGDDILADGY